MAVKNTFNLGIFKICANGLCFTMTNVTKSALPALSLLVAEQQSDTPNQHCRCHQKLVAGRLRKAGRKTAATCPIKTPFPSI